MAAALTAVAGSTALAQDAPEAETRDTAHSLRLPQNPQVFGTAIPSVVPLPLPAPPHPAARADEAARVAAQSRRIERISMVLGD